MACEKNIDIKRSMVAMIQEVLRMLKLAAYQTREVNKAL